MLDKQIRCTLILCLGLAASVQAHTFTVASNPTAPLCTIDADDPNGECSLQITPHSSTGFVMAAVTLTVLGYQYRQSSLMKKMLPMLLLAESTHFVLHLSVLLGSSIEGLTPDETIRYFSVDLLTTLWAFFMTESHPEWVALHTFIHVCAVAHLLIPWSGFFEDVFDMARQRYDDKPWLTVLAYNAGTLADMLTHALNTKVLFANLYRLQDEI